MTVIKRLQRLTGEEKTASGAANVRDGRKPGEGEAARAAEIGALRRRIDAVMSRRPPTRAESGPASLRGFALPLEECVRGEEISTEAGSFFCTEEIWGVSHRHGGRCIGDLAPLDMPGASILANDAALAALDYERGLFLDTETTGLAGGTGTVAFLIGLGWFVGSRFVTKQLFIRDYSEERAALIFLRELVRERQFLVTFNGKAFDVNLLAARFILNRLADPLTGLPHLDLLHPARRLLKHRLDNVRLGTLEGEVLDLEREGDVPGWEIPQRYFDWLRRRDGRLLADVFLHNRLDVMSMAALTAHLTDMIGGNGAGARGIAPPLHPPDLLAAARLLHHRGDAAGACRLLTELRGSKCPATVRQADQLLSLMHKRAGEWPAAVALWKEMIARDGNRAPGAPDGGHIFPLVELAKWCEHRDRDYAEALRLARRARQLLPAGTPAAERESLQRRLARLERRLAKAGQNW